MTTYRTQQTTGSIDGLVLVALGLVAFMGYSLLRDLQAQDVEATAMNDAPAIQAVTDLTEQVGSGRASPPELKPESLPVDYTAIAAPYEHYTITQGPHGFSYGHMAIDLAAGKGAAIKSPINGTATALYIDQWGNPTLVIENDYYQVTMLHGKYKVEVGQEVELGQMVGKESNLGYTTDMYGYSCRDRDCGYHTHLNIFDKRIGANINPLDVIGQ
jgi:murein DD-endopeptidase MepM/ murein hydrolase activator NlpD